MVKQMGSKKSKKDKKGKMHFCFLRFLSFLLFLLPLCASQNYQLEKCPNIVHQGRATNDYFAHPRRALVLTAAQAQFTLHKCLRRDPFAKSAGSPYIINLTGEAIAYEVEIAHRRLFRRHALGLCGGS